MTTQTAQSIIGRRLLLGVVVLSVVAGLFVAPGAVAAQEEVPAAYHGTLTVDGDPAPAGVEITAELEGTTYGPIITDDSGDFGGPTAGDRKLVVDPESAPDDTEVTFRVEGEEVETTVSWEAGDNQEVDLSISELPDSFDGGDDGSDDTGDSDDGSSGSDGGQSGGGSSASDTDDEAEQDTTETDSQAPTVEDVRSDLDTTDPDTDTSTEVTDSAPDNPGITVAPDGTESVQQITFNTEAATGSVEIREYQNPPASVSESVSAAVAADSTADGDDSSQAQGSTSVVSVADITPSDETTASSTATVTMTVDRDRLTDPQNAFIAHERDNSWEQLDTIVRESEDGEVTLQADVDSFSLFAVAEITASTSSGTNASTAETDDTDETDTSTEETGDGIPGFGFVVTLLAFVAGALIAHRKQ